MTDKLVDPFPISVLFVLFAIFSLACYEIGFRIGRWWQRRMPGEQEGPTDMLVGSLLALMAFLLAVTMGMASDRFDGRRGIVLAEANAMTAAFLQADYLPEPAAAQLKELVREYVPLRICTRGPLPAPPEPRAGQRAAGRDVGHPEGGGPLRATAPTSCPRSAGRSPSWPR